MSSIIQFLKKVYPDFAQARKFRRNIRKQYRKNLKALDRGDDVSLVMVGEDREDYLTQRAEKAAVNADHLIKKSGSRSDPYLYRITSGEDEVRDAFEDTIRKINRRNWMSYGVEFLFVEFVFLIFAFSISVGAYGIENIVNWLM